MRKLDSKKAYRGRSPPRGYHRDYYDGYDRRGFSPPRRRSPGYYSPPRRRRTPSPAGAGPRRRFIDEIPPETEQERLDRCVANIFLNLIEVEIV